MLVLRTSCREMLSGDPTFAAYSTSSSMTLLALDVSCLFNPNFRFYNISDSFLCSSCCL